MALHSFAAQIRRAVKRDRAREARLTKTETPEQTKARHAREMEARLAKVRAETRRAAAEQRELERLAAAGRTASAGQGDDRPLREREMMKLTGLSRTTIWRMERAGRFPKRVKIGERAVAWSEREVRAWLAARRADRTL